MRVASSAGAACAATAVTARAPIIAAAALASGRQCDVAAARQVLVWGKDGNPYLDEKFKTWCCQNLTIAEWFLEVERVECYRRERTLAAITTVQQHAPAPKFES